MTKGPPRPPAGDADGPRGGPSRGLRCEQLLRARVADRIQVRDRLDVIAPGHEPLAFDSDAKSQNCDVQDACILPDPAARSLSLDSRDRLCSWPQAREGCRCIIRLRHALS